MIKATQMIHPTYTHPGVNAALLELSRARSRSVKWKRIEHRAKLDDHSHIALHARRILIIELRTQHRILARLMRLASQ